MYWGILQNVNMIQYKDWKPYIDIEIIKNDEQIYCVMSVEFTQYI